MIIQASKKLLGSRRADNSALGAFQRKLEKSTRVVHPFYSGSKGTDAVQEDLELRLTAGYLFTTSRRRSKGAGQTICSQAGCGCSTSSAHWIPEGICLSDLNERPSRFQDPIDPTPPPRHSRGVLWLLCQERWFFPCQSLLFLHLRRDVGRVKSCLASRPFPKKRPLNRARQEKNGMTAHHRLSPSEEKHHRR